MSGVGGLRRSVMKFEARSTFDDALEYFTEFLRSQDVSDRLLWLTRDRVTQYKKIVWVFRPYELSSDISTRRFYQHLVPTVSSIRIDAFPFGSDQSLAWVEDFGGPSGLLNFGLVTADWKVVAVDSHIEWRFICLFNWLRDLRYLRYRLRDKRWNISPRTEQVGAG